MTWTMKRTISKLWADADTPECRFRGFCLHGDEMYDKLQNIDPQLLRLNAAEGSILISNALQGRIFAEIGGTLVHNFLPELAEHPSPERFNNIGGNSLWPAPEGGPFAYNYPSGGPWTVQPGINTAPTRTVEAGPEQVRIAKEITLLNRRGRSIDLEFPVRSR